MKMVRHVWGNIKLGTLVLLVFGLVTYLSASAYRAIATPTSAFFDDPYLQGIFLIFMAYAVGGALTSKSVKSLISRLTEYKHLSFLRYFHIADIKDRKFPEVIFWKGGDVYAVGNVMNEFQDKDGVVWCRVIDPTYPSVVTGFLALVKKENLIYTGRSIKDTTIMNLSIGTK